MKKLLSMLKSPLSGICMLIGVVLITFFAPSAYKDAEQSAYKEIKACVTNTLKNEMTARGDSILKRERNTMHRIANKYPKKYPFEVKIGLNDKPKKYQIDSISDSINIAISVEMRMAQSISMYEQPFQIDSFLLVCQKLLAAKGIYGNLGFKLSNDRNVKTVGDTSYITPFYQATIGYGCEYRIEAGVRMPFFFNNTIIYTTIAIAFLLLIAVGCYILFYLHKKESEKQPWVKEVEKGKYLLNTHWLYIPEELQIYFLEQDFFRRRKTFIPKITFQKRESQIFTALLQATDYSIKPNELFNKVWVDTCVEATNNLQAKISTIRKKIKEVGLEIVFKNGTYTLQVRKNEGKAILDNQ